MNNEKEFFRYVIAAYGFLIEDYDWTFGQFAEAIKRTYDIRNRRNREVYDFLMESKNKKIKEAL